ncbi:hypothetical protein [Nocardia sp. alder85J]|uniref:hypothetical protein n=1 Tax=Nocardia sp. alder85J TaxID=2862949 RepID=UPI001CD64D13|nr:hypothetical protein [Nocardia sp. alder85J]MCX4092826.1 hypothetical protein [Nocardia sp. alder85J]
MRATPIWARRNRFVAWTSYLAVLIGFATLAMALTAAASGHTRWAMVAGGLCAAVVIVSIGVLAATVHRDHTHHHGGPNLLTDEWDQASAARARRRAAARAAAPRTWPGI